MALAIIIVAKFTEGAWITILVIPCVIVLLKAIKRYYDELDARLRDDGPLYLAGLPPPLVLVTTEGWNRLTDKALAFALSFSPDVIAVHLAKLDPDEDEEKEARLRRQWEEDVERPARKAGLRPPRLVILQAPYRRFQGPLLKLIEGLEAEHPSRTIAVLIPEVVKRYWWQQLTAPHPPGAAPRELAAPLWQLAPRRHDRALVSPGAADRGGGRSGGGGRAQTAPGSQRQARRRPELNLQSPIPCRRVMRARRARRISASAAHCACWGRLAGLPLR
jgi:hypothetical protein